ncbi:MAG: glycosyltransferase family 2 protein [Candidatus Omnitrophica bacterium]|nr:glycosyltransferase family 2 protein [Candidatus Omnitrophota bacterium]MBU1128568.1 glycosyltransferase family 2 protein [Candidatus Omnitrophota bacterium]MBU1657288.1 glycosyltransferase family 2 protein [Candidatus Omnitrophota bacterium]MBU1784782.1 glycosyltransferase family 2 protein [Candidatus Omnitrophota bacterium]MBU1851572.1 glycosyltransferase family 2 protein [Candidatus Omnitrophota bacterium]
MKISVLMPVYNEFKTIADVVDLVKNVDFDKEIIIVDDCSTDGTRELLRKTFGDGTGVVRVFYHEKNSGKGAAIRTAISRASGDYVVVQDADMEYSPHEIMKLVSLADVTGAEAVFGSRFKNTWRATSLPHYLVNWFLTALTNILFGSHLTDMETCYKMVRTDVIRELDIRADRFEFEPEVTAKLLKKGVKIQEVPISYRGRGYDEGKKITWKDGFEAVLAILRYRFQK